MEDIVFHKEPTIWSRTHSYGPVFNLWQVHSFENEEGWSIRIGNVRLKILMRALDREGNILGNPSEWNYHLAKYISVSDKQPVLTLNEPNDLRKDQPSLDLSKCIQWKIDVTISGLDFRPKEKLFVYYTVGLV